MKSKGEKVNCSFEGCGREATLKGFCNGHYRQFKAGKKLKPLSLHSLTTGMGTRERFMFYVKREGDCWIWTGRVTRDGYSYFKVDGKNVRAHRWAYEKTHGPIAAGMQIDHTCHNRACVNADHLRVVTHKQNMENRAKAQANSGTGVRGVQFRYGRYRAYIGHNHKSYHLGTYETIDQAETAAITARVEMFTHNDIDRTRAAIDALLGQAV